VSRSTKAQPSLARRITDPRYERELRELEEERDAQLAAWQRGVAADRRMSEEVFLANRHRRVLQRIAITARFWQASEEAYFDCCQRNPHLLPRRVGRPRKHFRWFRTVPTGQAPRVGRRRIDNRETGIVTRAVALLRACEGDAKRGTQRPVVARLLAEAAVGTPARSMRAQLRHHEQEGASEALSSVRAVRRLDPARFDRVARSVSRALRHPAK
jgi:hypothetical protein